MPCRKLPRTSPPNSAFRVRTRTLSRCARSSGRRAAQGGRYLCQPDRTGRLAGRQGLAPVTVGARRTSARRTSQEALAKLKPIVRPGGTVTAGNAAGDQRRRGGGCPGDCGGGGQTRADARARAHPGHRAIAGIHATHHGHRAPNGDGPNCSTRLGLSLGRPGRDRTQRGVRGAGTGPACGNLDFPTMPRTSTRMAAPSHSAIRSACPVRGS